MTQETTARIAISMLLCGLVVAIFGPVIGQSFQAFDDPRFVLTNPQIIDPGGEPLANLLFQPRIGYIVPLTGLVQATLWKIGGGAPWPFHATALALHLVVTLLVFRLGLRLTKNLVPSALAALLFALHPVVVEPVAWATGMKDMLMASCALGGTLLFVRALAEADDEDASPWPMRWASLLALGALLAKPTGALIGFAWVAVLVSRKLAGERVPAGLVRSLVALCTLTTLVTIASWYMHNTLLVGNDASVDRGSWHVPMALGHQLQHLVFPDVLAPMYRIDREAGFADPMTYVGIVGLIAFFGAVWLARKRPRITLGLALAFAAYFPVSNIVPFPRMVADSYLYVPLAALLVALAVAAEPLFARVDGALTVRAKVMTAATLCVVALLAWRTHDQVMRWGDPIGLWYPVAEADDWDFAWMEMADSLRFVGRHEDAIHVYEQLYARYYPPDFLHKTAIAHVEAGHLAEAECLMIEDAHHGHDPATAIRNFAVLFVINPDYRARHPAFARIALIDAAYAIEAGELEWSDEMRRELAVRLEDRDLMQERPIPPWPKRSCPSLNAELIPGRPGG